jgi:fermentation-respiration switch protein FrsA (DUF1100 family)
VTQTSPQPMLTLEDVIRLPEDDASERLRLVTSQGAITSRLHPAEGEKAILWVFGAGGGLGGPAGGVYTRLGRQVQPSGVTSLELGYRRPGYLQDCVLDVLVGLAYLETLGKSRIVLVGHSFGGAVVINAGAISAAVVAVAALSSQTAGTGGVDRLSPKPVLFIHGEADEVLPADCSRDLYARAGEPKALILYSGCRHGLDQCREALDEDLTGWINQVLAPAK